MPHDQCTCSFIPDFAAEVVGLDLRKPPDAATVEEIEHAIDRYPVLVLRDQDLTDEQQIAFTRPFGDLQQSMEYLTEKGELRLPGAHDRFVQHRQGQQDVRCRRRAAHEQSRQPPLAHRPVVQDAAGEVFAAVRRARSPSRAGRRSSRTCAARTKHCPRSSRNASTDIVIEHSLLNSRRNGRIHRRDRARESPPRLGAPAPGAAPPDAPGAGRCTCRRTRRTSWGGRSPRGSTCCMSSPIAPRSRSSSTRTRGACTTRPVGQPRHDAPRAPPHRPRPIRATCGASRCSTKRTRSLNPFDGKVDP